MSDQEEKKPAGAHRLGPLVAAEIHDGFVQGVVGSHMILQGLLAFLLRGRLGGLGGGFFVRRGF